MARPQKKLDEKQVAQVEALASVLTLEQIADYFGMHRETFNAVCERQPEVFRQYKKGKSRAIASISQNLIKQAQDGNTTAAIFYLKTQAGWRETNNIDINANVKAEMSSLSELMDELENED